MLIVYVAAAVGIAVLGMLIGFYLSRPRTDYSSSIDNQGIFVDLDANRPQPFGFDNEPSPTPAEFGLGETAIQNTLADELDEQLVEEVVTMLRGMFLGQKGGIMGMFAMLNTMKDAYQNVAHLLQNMTPEQRQALGETLKARSAEWKESIDPNQMQSIVDVIEGVSTLGKDGTLFGVNEQE